MDINEQYSKVNRAGKWAFWLGVIQILVIPLLIYVDLHDPKISHDVQVGAAVIDTVLQLIISALLIIFGRKAQRAVVGDLDSLKRTDKARLVISITLGLTLLLAISVGSRPGLLAIFVILQLVWASKASKLIKQNAAGGTPPAGAAPAAPAQPTPTDPMQPAVVNPVSTPAEPAPAAAPTDTTTPPAA